MGALLTQFMNRYAYTDFHELNADWMIRTMMELINQVENFVSLNAIKYADPIQWNITSQYEKNTIVIDPLSGVAYISVKPVPMGVALTNTYYWTVVFDLSMFIVRAAKNFTNRYEADTTLTATFASTQGDWLVWGDVLYEVIIPTINAGDQYVVDSNIRHITMEEVCDALAQAIDAVDTKVGDLTDLTTSDTSSIVNAINSVLSDLNITIGDLANLTTTDKSSVVNAINEIDGNVGDLNNLITTDNTSVVNAINEVKQFEVDSFYVTPEMYGAVGDGVTDDSQALQDALDSGHGVFLSKEKTYLCSSKLLIKHKVNLYGNGASVVLNAVDFGIEIDIDELLRENMYAGIIDNVRFSGSAPVLIRVYNATKSTIDNCYFNGFTGEAIHIDNDCYEMQFSNLRFFGGNATCKGIVTWSNDDSFDNLYFCDCHTGIETHSGANYFNTVHGWILTPAYLSGSKLFDIYDYGYFHPNWLSNIYNDTYMYGIYIQSHQLIIINGFYNLVNYSIWSAAGDPTGYVIYYAAGDYKDYSFRLICHDLRVSGKAELEFCNVAANLLHAQLDWDGCENVYLTNYTDYFVDDWELIASTGTTFADNHAWRDGNFLHINAVLQNSGTGYTALFELPYWLKQYIKNNMYLPCDISSTQYDNSGDMERCYAYMGTNGVYTAQMKSGFEWVTVNITIPLNFLQNV